MNVATSSLVLMTVLALGCSRYELRPASGEEAWGVMRLDRWTGEVCIYRKPSAEEQRAYERERDRLGEVPWTELIERDRGGEAPEEPAPIILAGCAE